MYLTQSLHRNVQQASETVATVDGVRRRTWLEWRNRVAKFAGGLREIGLQSGDRVAMLARNSDRYLEYLFGTFWAGGVINPVNIRWSSAEIAYSLTNCSTRILIVDSQFAAMVPEIRANAPQIQTIIAIDCNPGDALNYEAWLQSADPIADVLRSDDDLAAVLYTGGTTGFPKGVMLSHRNLVSSAIGTIAMEAGRCGPRYLHCAPLFHVGALSGLFLAMLSGSTQIILPGFEPLPVLEMIARERITDVFLVPTMIRMLLDHPDFASFDVTHLKKIRYGASAIDDALLDRAMVAFPNASFIQLYGMTEMAPVVAVLGPADHSTEARRQGRGRSTGRATPMVELRIVDAEDNEVPPGTIGEICARGSTTMLGYWELPELTAEVLRGGWMHTGDIGRMDQAGYVTVVDRLKDVIVTGGENVYSAEVESALCTHEAVAQVAVIAVPHDKWGEQVHAVIVLHTGASADVASLQAHVRTRIAGYKVPRSFSFIESLPLSAAGKVLKNELREQHRNNSLADA